MSGTTRIGSGDGAGLEPYVLDPRQQVLVQPLMEAGVQDRVGRHEVDGLEARQPREQIEVGHPQPMAIGGLIGDGDDDAAVERTR
jgi:hypothetical protein